VSLHAVSDGKAHPQIDNIFCFYKKINDNVGKKMRGGGGGGGGSGVARVIRETKK
jgi:hypothetical protein